MKRPGQERDIIKAIRQGGQEADRALRSVYLLVRTTIELWIKNNSGTSEEAKDVTQEAIIAFYENVRSDKFRGESSISTYLLSIARFIWFNKLKRKKLESEKLAEIVKSDHTPELPARVEEEESRQQLLALFEKLGHDCQQVLLEAIYYGHSMKEIAKNLQYDNEQVARNKKYLCMKRLKAMIKKDPSILRILNY